MDMTIQELADYARGFFETFTRGEKKPDSEIFYSMKNERPHWIKAMVYAAHNDKSPDDFTYATIVEVLDAIAEGQAPDELNLEADVYNHDLIAWLASHGHRPAYVDEAVEELGHSGQGILGDIGSGQYWEKREVGDFVTSALEKRLENPSDHDDMETATGREKLDRGGPEDWDPRTSKKIPRQKKP